MAPIIANIDQVAIVMSQAAEPTRLRILLELWDGEVPMSQLVERLGVSSPSVSHHLKILKMGAIISRRRAGTHSYYSLTDTGRLLVDVACQV